MHLETWNEFHEGTEICHSREYGRQYIDLTREFADQFHAGQKLDRSLLRSGPAGRHRVAGKSDGLCVVPEAGRRRSGVGEDRGRPSGLEHDAEQAFPRRPLPVLRRRGRFPIRHGRVRRDDGDYQDAGPAEFRVEYDSSDPQLEGLRQQFRSGPSQPITGSGHWKESRFVLPHACFAGRSNGADFRLAAVAKDLVVGRVSVRRLAP